MEDNGEMKVPSPGQVRFGNKVVELARFGVKKFGYEQAIRAALMAHMEAFHAFTKRVPNCGTAGQAITVDEAWESAYQEMIGSMALLTAVVAEKVGVELSREVPAEN